MTAAFHSGPIVGDFRFPGVDWFLVVDWRGDDLRQIGCALRILIVMYESLSAASAGWRHSLWLRKLRDLVSDW